MSVESTPQAGEPVRAKWAMDGAATLAEAAAMLRAKADWLQRLHDEGWTLAHPVEDDYGYLVTPDGDAGEDGPVTFTAAELS